MAIKKKSEESTETSFKDLTPKQRLRAMIEKEQAASLKDKTELKVGHIADFAISGLDAIIPTGLIAWDVLFNGMTKGRIYEIAGQESAGKSTTCWELIQRILMTEPEASIVYFDAERTIDSNFLRRFPFINAQENVVFIRESIIENIWERCEEYIKAKAVDYVFIDSVGALMSQSEMDKDISENVMGDPARKYSWGFKKLYDFMDSGVTFVFINQFRDNIGQMFGPTKKLMGE